MESVIAALGAEKNDLVRWNSSLLVALERFNSRNAGNMQFKADEKEVTEYLGSSLRQLRSDFERESTVRELSVENFDGLILSIRICARDRVGNSILREEENVEFICRLIGLGSERKKYLINSEIESIKCLVNLLICDEMVRLIAHRMKLTSGAIQLISGMGDSPHKWIIFRMIFAISVYPKARESLLSELSAIPLCIQELERCNHDGEFQDPLSSEILNLLFSLTRDYFELETTSVSEASIVSKKLLNVFSALLVSSSSSWKMKKTSIEIMMNIPNRDFDVFILENPQFSHILVECLAHTLEHGDEYGQDMLGVMSVLKNCCKASKESLLIIRKSLLPDYDEEKSVAVSPPPCPPGSLKSKILKFFNSPSPEVQQIIGQLFFEICEEDANKFSSEVGLGHGAGLLASIGLINPAQLTRPSRSASAASASAPSSSPSE